MYVLLTGLKPHHEKMHDDKYLKNTIKNAGTSFIDPRFELRSFGDQKLVEIIRKC